ncbi:hypothetical protein LBMAG56_47460 [Verrucomicrobiota bacterium]|nr:hypothetical protein LBMAG56_47460 [Verrucomicrobiota bacterium]
MNLHSLPATTLTAPNLAGLPGEGFDRPTGASTPEKLGTACREFEAMFLRKILEQARQPMLKPKTTPGNSGNENYQDMVNFHLANTLSQTGAFGLASSLQAQLDRQLDLKTPTAAASALRPPTFSPLHD